MEKFLDLKIGFFLVLSTLLIASMVNAEKGCGTKFNAIKAEDFVASAPNSQIKIHEVS